MERLLIIATIGNFLMFSATVGVMLAKGSQEHYYDDASDNLALNESRWTKTILMPSDNEHLSHMNKFELMCQQ